MNSKYEAQDALFATLIYLFSSRDVWNRILDILGSFDYSKIHLTLGTYYRGFSTTNYLLAPGRIFYTSLNANHFNGDEYQEGKVLWWTKMMRGTLEPSIAHAFAGPAGAVIAIELDSGFPHYHIRNAKVLNPDIVHQHGVYLFPWFWFKVETVITIGEVTIIKVVQTPWPKIAEESLTLGWEDMENGQEHATTRLYHNKHVDVKDVYTQNLVKSVGILSKLYGTEHAHRIIGIDQNTKIPLNGWEW